MNVLLTACGRRSYMVEYFRQALGRRGLVICANSDAMAPAMRTADLAIPVLRSDHPDYPQQVLDLCARHKVKMVTSLHDLDLYVLSQYKQDFVSIGCIPVLPDHKTAHLSLDKHEMNLALARLGIDTPWSSLHVSAAIEAIEQGRLQWPLIVKDRTGFGSLGMLECASVDELQYAVRRINRQGRMVEGFYQPSVEPEQAALIQPKIGGAEFCLGLISDLGGKLVGKTRSEIHAMRGGESDLATTWAASEDFFLAKSLADLLRVPGYCGIDYLEHEEKKLLIDINPRFTGDYPFSHLAGLNVPAALVAWIRGEEPKPEWLVAQPGISGYKDIVLRQG